MRRAPKNGTERRATAPANPAPPERQVKTLPPGRYPMCLMCGFGEVLHDAKGHCVGPGAKGTKWDPEPLTEVADAA